MAYDQAGNHPSYQHDISFLTQASYKDLLIYASAVKPVVLPALDISAMNASEDNPVSIYLSARSSDSASRNIFINITEFPTGSMFSRGTFNGQFWILTSDDFGNVELFLPEHLSGTFEITAEAFYTNTSAVTVGTVQFTVQSVPDAPTLSVLASPCIDSGSLTLIVNSSLVDSDGSESLVVTVSGLPIGSQLSAGQVNEKGNYTLQPAELQRSIIVSMLPSSLNTVNIDIIATTTEMSNNRTTSTNTTASVNKCPESKPQLQM